MFLMSELKQIFPQLPPYLWELLIVLAIWQIF